MRSIPGDWSICLQISFILSNSHPFIYLFPFLVTYLFVISVFVFFSPYNLFVEENSYLYMEFPISEVG